MQPPILRPPSELVVVVPRPVRLADLRGALTEWVREPLAAAGERVPLFYVSLGALQEGRNDDVRGTSCVFTLHVQTWEVGLAIGAVLLVRGILLLSCDAVEFLRLHDPKQRCVQCGLHLRDGGSHPRRGRCDRQLSVRISTYAMAVSTELEHTARAWFAAIFPRAAAVGFMLAPRDKPQPPEPPQQSAGLSATAAEFVPGGAPAPKRGRRQPLPEMHDPKMGAQLLSLLPEPEAQLGVRRSMQREQRLWNRVWALITKRERHLGSPDKVRLKSKAFAIEQDLTFTLSCLARPDLCFDAARQRSACLWQMSVISLFTQRSLHAVDPYGSSFMPHLGPAQLQKSAPFQALVHDAELASVPGLIDATLETAARMYGDVCERFRLELRKPLPPAAKQATRTVLHNFFRRLPSGFFSSMASAKCMLKLLALFPAVLYPVLGVELEWVRFPTLPKSVDRHTLHAAFWTIAHKNSKGDRCGSYMNQAYEMRVLLVLQSKIVTVQQACAQLDANPAQDELHKLTGKRVRELQRYLDKARTGYGGSAVEDLQGGERALEALLDVAAHRARGLESAIHDARKKPREDKVFAEKEAVYALSVVEGELADKVGEWVDAGPLERTVQTAVRTRFPKLPDPESATLQSIAEHVPGHVELDAQQGLVRLMQAGAPLQGLSDKFTAAALLEAERALWSAPGLWRHVSAMANEFAFGMQRSKRQRLAGPRKDDLFAVFGPRLERLPTDRFEVVMTGGASAVRLIGLPVRNEVENFVMSELLLRELRQCAQDGEWRRLKLLQNSMQKSQVLKRTFNPNKRKLDALRVFGPEMHALPPYLEHSTEINGLARHLRVVPERLAERVALPLAVKLLTRVLARADGRCLPIERAGRLFARAMKHRLPGAHVGLQHMFGPTLELLPRERFERPMTRVGGLKTIRLVDGVTDSGPPRYTEPIDEVGARVLRSLLSPSWTLLRRISDKFSSRMVPHAPIGKGSIFERVFGPKLRGLPKSFEVRDRGGKVLRGGKATRRHGKGEVLKWRLRVVPEEVVVEEEEVVVEEEEVVVEEEEVVVEEEEVVIEEEEEESSRPNKKGVAGYDNQDYALLFAAELGADEEEHLIDASGLEPMAGGDGDGFFWLSAAPVAIARSRTNPVLDKPS